MAEAVNRSLQRGLQLLELLSEHPEGMELHEICKALELPKSSGHNLGTKPLRLGFLPWKIPPDAENL